jgi:DNA-binding CsgD family transcriptional regulator
MESEEMLVSVEQHLDTTQRSVLRLRLDGYTEFEIGERLQLSISTVKGIRRSIASIVKAAMPDAYPEQRANRQEARKNSFEKWEFFQRRTRRLRLIT